MSKKGLYVGAVLGLIAAAAGGFAAARFTMPSARPVATEAAASPPETNEGPKDTISITDEGIRASAIKVAAVGAGTLDATILAPAIVRATPDAEAVLTARAAGTVTRIFKRIGDAVRQGETVALVESREASTIAAERASANAKATLARQQLERERKLLAQGVSPRADYEAAQANLSLAQAEATRVSAAASAAGVSSDGRSVAVVSPITGRITGAPASLGAYVQAETELFRVADPRRLQLEASVPAADAGRVRTNDPVELMLDANTTLRGQVRAATGVVDAQTRQATVLIAPTDANVPLLPGQLVRARILSSGDARTGVTVPQDAVQTLDTTGSVVFVRTAEGFRAQPIVIARRGSGMVEIASGVTAGTMIATDNAFLLKAELGKEGAE